MSDLVQGVKDGEIQQTNASSSKTSTKGSGNELGKEAFLQLLTTQMKYQDPLNPNTDTEYIAQLATFSQLEQLQNLSSATTNSQALSLVGKEVTVKTDSKTGAATYVNGRVDFATISGSDVKLSINGKLYSYKQLDSVVANEYLAEKALPAVTETQLKYDASNPKKQSFDVSLGSGDTVANKLQVAIGESVIDSSLVSVSGNTVTIDTAAFKNLVNGNYKLAVAFNDSKNTVIENKVTLQVTNSNAEADNSTTKATNDEA